MGARPAGWTVVRRVLRRLLPAGWAAGSLACSTGHRLCPAVPAQPVGPAGRRGGPLPHRLQVRDSRGAGRPRFPPQRAGPTSETVWPKATAPTRLPDFVLGRLKEAAQYGNAPRSAQTPPTSWPRQDLTCWRNWSTRTGGAATADRSAGARTPPSPRPGPLTRETTPSGSWSTSTGAGQTARPTLASRPCARSWCRTTTATPQGTALAPPRLKAARAAALVLGDRLSLRPLGTLRTARTHHQLEGVRRSSGRDLRS